MNTLNRILVIIGDLIVLAALVSFVLLIVGALAPETILPSPQLAASVRDRIPVTSPARVAAVAASAAVFFLGLVLLYYELRPGTAAERHVMVSDDADGRVTVSMEGLSELASREARTLPGVRAASSRITDGGRALHVAERVTVAPGANVPDVTRAVQAHVKEVVEHTMGRPVSEVRVHADVARPDQERPRRQLR